MTRITANPLPIIVAENTLERLVGRPVPGQRHLDIQRDGRHDLLLQHQQVQPRRHPADRASGHSATRWHRPVRLSVQIVDHGTAPHHDHLQRHGDGAQPVERAPSATAGRSRAWSRSLGHRRRDPQPGSGRRAASGSRAAPAAAADLHHPGRRFLDARPETPAAGYTRTLTDGTQITFDSGGYETATIDLNGLHTTYTYNESHELTRSPIRIRQLSRRFTYSSAATCCNRSRTPPAGSATFTILRRQPTAVQQADGSHITYTYDGSGRMTQLKDPLSQRGLDRLRSRRASGHDHVAGPRHRGIQRLPGAGLDQQRHLGQPGAGDAVGRVGRDLHRPQRQHLTPSAARLVRAGHDRRRRSTPSATWPPTTSIPTACRSSRSIHSTGSPRTSYDSTGTSPATPTPTGPTTPTPTTASPSR